MKTFEEEITGLYTRSGFGKVLKAEIDAVVFHHILLRELKAIEPSLVSSDGAIDYLRVNKSHIYQLAQRLKTKETQILSLLENDALGHGGGSKALRTTLLELFKRALDKRECLKNGSLRLYVPNPVLRKEIENKAFLTNGEVDFSFNKDLMVIPLYDFLKLLDFSGEEIWRIAKECFSKSVVADKRDNIKALAEKLQQPPVGEQIKGVVVDLAKHFLGDGMGDAAFGLVTRVYTSVKGALK
jgi:hypothetical protein